MRPAKMTTAALILIVATSCVHGESSLPSTAAAEEELRRVDERQSEIAQSGNAAAMAALLHPAYAVHLPNGQVIDYQRTMALVRTGLLSRERHSRSHERVLVNGSIGVVMGVDRLEAPPPLATRGELTRRYTNVYVRDRGRWRHLARHFHFLP